MRAQPATIAATGVRWTLAVVAMLLAACGGATASPATPRSPAVSGEAVDTLEAGRVESLPTGPVYVRFIGFAQPPGYLINSKQHVPSIVYVESGEHRLVLMGQDPIDIAAGQAKFHQSITHVHLNPGTEPSLWYAIAVWPSSARGQPLVDAIAHPAFESDDVDPSLLPQVPYSEVLRRVALHPGGQSVPHRFGGVATFFVLTGSLTIRSGRHAPTTLTSHQGAAFLPDVDLQEKNPGSGDAVFLEFLTTPVGKAFEVPLSRVGG